MPEKNVQSAQWTKSAAQKVNYDTFGAVVGLGGSISTPLYGGGATGLAVVQTQPLENLQDSYGNARFPTPTLSSRHAVAPPPPSSTTSTTVLMPLGATSTNVPGIGGFVPPSYSALASTSACSAATSVLTPNPFALHNSNGGGTSGSSNSTAFGLEQFQQLNAQQQFEFTKMMTVINTTASVTPKVSPTTASASVLNSASSSSNITISSQLTTSSRQHMELSTTSGAITSSTAENVLNAISAASSSVCGQGRVGVKLPDEEKMRRIQHVVESGVGDQAKQQILQILERISTLKPMEKLLLYLRMPGEAPDTDPLRHPQNPLGTRSEINHTINWVRSHLEHDPQVSIPKQDVYNEYITFCDRLAIKPLSTADFGKVMKQVFPEIRPRRLGTRGHSRYCYAAMRKTTKLNAPQLPQLGSNVQTPKPMGVCEPSTKLISGAEYADPSVDWSDSSWHVIKVWAESILNVKVENMKSLAAHIQTNNLIKTASTGPTSTLQFQKKGLQRESKEKRSTGDFGPLKKRQKKKRKGSSSSESSCNQPQQSKRIECSLIPNTGPPSASIVKEDGKDFTTQSVEIKQEIMDSPIYQNVQNSVPPNVTISGVASVNLTDANNQKHTAFGYNQLHQHSTLIQQQQQQQQKHQGIQQLLPMNLATETRTVLARTPISADGLTTFPGRVSNAVQNLTAKIMDLSAQATSVSSSSETVPVSVPITVPIALPIPATTTAVSELNTRIMDQTVIKEEVIDDYNPTNVFCKKVLKAQQTKGFWTNSPSSSAAVTITSSPISVITTTNTAPPLRSVEVETSLPSSYLMGPPAQINTSTSPSLTSSTAPVSTLLASTSIVPSAAPENATSTTLIAQARVSSRNMMQLRAKKLRYYQMRENIINNSSPSSDQPGGEGTAEIDKDTDLPENLGLPRERVISICNMDKHELDDYFLPGEEENSQDQEAELLQYFQMGDAEEKSNSLDDAKINGSPTASHLPSCTNNHRQNIVTGLVGDKRSPRGTQAYLNKLLSTTPLHAGIVVNDGVNIVIGANDDMSLKNIRSVGDGAQSQALTPAVGSASASLALMSQKHQQQQQKNKRKTNSGNTSLLSSINKSTTRKNCIFLPISPNINNSIPSAAVSVAQGVTNGNVLFVSPGLTRLRPKPGVLCKQLSLDCDASSNSDPMICASRRRKTTYSSSQIVQINTSASAPPSPSLLQQKRQATGMHQKQHRQSVNDQWPLTNHITNYNDFTHHNDASLLVDQNSLDLDIFNANPPFEQDSLIDATFTAECSVFTPLSETQRSQSVPLSQLQRIHSPAFNRNIQTNFSTCTSVAQTPVPSEFTDFSMFGDNSQSGVFGNQHSIKLETGSSLMVSESSTVLDEVDVSDILSSPDFVSKFSNAAHSSHAVTAATCSSAGSSSGYSSSTCTVFGGITANSILSRSVPSTPLPHQKQYPFGGGNGGGGGGRLYDRQRTIDEIQLSPTETGIKSPAGTLTSTSAKYISSQLLSRTAYDISKSMPTTPITTPSFRYSPVEFHRDFLINGNTLESITSLPLPMNVLSSDSFMNGTMDTLNADTLMDNGGIVTSDDFTVVGAAVDADSSMVGSDLLDNL